MTNYVSYLLAANAAKRRLAELFESETLDSEGYRSAAIVADDPIPPPELTPNKITTWLENTVPRKGGALLIR